MTQKAKQSQATPRAMAQVVLFGLDESGKPKAARFSEAQASLATKAAAQLKLNVLTVNDAKIAELAARLQSGRVHANGKGFIPAVRRDVYSKLLEAAGQSPDAQAASQSSDAAAQPSVSKLTSKRPQHWSEIAVGHIVIIQDDDPKDGWWEAIVVTAAADMLHLRWRANPKQRAIARHRLSVGLMYPDQAATDVKSSAVRTSGATAQKQAAGAASSQPAKPAYPASWAEIAPDQLVLAREDGPLGQWWEAIVVSRTDDTCTLRWRDYSDLSPIVRPWRDLTLLHPSGK